MFELVSTLGLLVGILLILFRDKPSLENIWLALFFISNVLYAVLTQALFLNENRWIVNTFFPYFVTFNYSSGPFLYFYFRYKARPERKFSLKDLSHFIIPFILFLNSSPYIFIKEEIKDSFLNSISGTPANLLKFPYLFFEYQYQVWGRPILTLIYVLVCSFMLWKSYSRDRFKFFSHFEMRYLVILLGTCLVHYYFSITALVNFSVAPPITQTILDYKNWIMIPRISFFLMLISILFFPQLIFQKFFPNTLPESHLLKRVALRADGSAIVPQYDLELIAKVVNEYLVSKPYLKQGFSLFNFSEETKIPQHQLTYYLKVIHEQTFNDFKNNLRIEHAIELLESGKAKNQTLESISIECGYRSRTNFIDAFKKITGKTPSDYLKA